MHVEPPPILLIKSKNYDKPEKDCVNLTLRRYTTSDKLDIYEFKMDLFHNSYLEEFLLLIYNFNMTLKASGTLETAAKVQYLRTLVRGEALHQFKAMSDEVEGTNPLTVEAII